MGRYILRAATFIPALPGYLLGLFFVLFRNCDSYYEGTFLVIHMPKIKWWPYSTTVTRTVLLRPEADETEVLHEHRHLLRAEDYCITSLILGIAVAPFAPWPALAIYLSSPLWPLIGYLTAALRGLNWYRDALDESEARALSEKRRSP